MSSTHLSIARDTVVLHRGSSALFLERLQTDDALLTYGATTDPSPVQASASPTNLSVATLTIVVSCAEIVGSATVRQLVVTIPSDTPTVAPDPTSLAAVAPTKATIVSSGTDQWRVATGTVPGSFVFTPKGGPVAVSLQGLTITVPNIQVSTLVGTATITITEWAAQGSDEPPPVTDPPSGSATLKVSKFPQGFTISTFDATTPALGPDYDTTISWAGSDRATYSIQYDETTIPNPRDPKAKPLPPQGSIQVANLLHDPTIFTLVVKAQAGGATLTARRQTAVTVQRARVDKFIAMPTNLAKGATCKVSWQTNGDRVELEDQSFDGPNGSADIIVTASRSLNLTVFKGSDVTQDSRNVTVMPQVISTFTAMVKGVPVTGPIEAGSEVVLAWATRYASAVTLAPDAAPPFGAQGKVTVKPVKNTTYTLTTTGLLPDVKQTIPIAIVPVTISSFTAQPSTVDPGTTLITFAWATSRATSAKIEYFGDVAPIAAGSIPIRVSAYEDSTFTLTCNGPMGPVSRAVVLRVNSVRITRFDNSGTGRIDRNQLEDYVLAWSTELATKVQLTVDANGVFPGFASGVAKDVAASGQLVFKIGPFYSPIYFTLVAWGPGKSPISRVTISPDNR